MMNCYFPIICSEFDDVLLFSFQRMNRGSAYPSPLWKIKMYIGKDIWVYQQFERLKCSTFFSPTNGKLHMYQNQHWCDNFTAFDKFQLLQTLGADVCLILSLEHEKCAKIVFRYFLQGRNCTEFSNLLCRRRFFLRHHLIQKIWNKTGILIR